MEWLMNWCSENGVELDEQQMLSLASEFDTQLNTKFSQELPDKLDGEFNNKVDTAVNAKVNQHKQDFAVEQALNRSGARQNKAVMALLDLSGLSLDDNGKLNGIDEQLQKLQKSDPYLFAGGTMSGVTPATGNSVSGKGTVERQIAKALRRNV